MPVIAQIIPNEILNNAKKIPIVGLGASGMNDVPGSTTDAIKLGIDLGYRYIDIAGGMNEKEVGNAIADKIKEGVVKREELFLVGKLQDTRAFHKTDLILENVLTTLRNLNMAYIDMYVINSPEGADVDNEALVETWNVMEQLVDKFLVKSIGLANCNADQIHHLLISARVLPVTNQIECNPYRTQRALTEFCNQKHILVTGMNIFGSEDLMEHPMVMKIAKKYNKTPEQILMRYQVDKGHASVLPVDKKANLMKNLDVFKFELSKRDIADMENLDKQYT